MNRVTHNAQHIKTLTLAFSITLAAVIIAIVFLKQTTATSITVGSARLYIEEARTAEEQAKGLGDRATLNQDHGMLFRFADNSHPEFWMKGMRFPLDFIWIDDNKVVQLNEHIAAPLMSMSEDKLPKIIPDSPVDALIEVNAGFVEYYKIKLGDVVKGLE